MKEAELEHYLVVFDRTTGEAELRAFPTSSEAMRARFEAERRHYHDGRFEVVVLTGESKESLRRSHARYFEPLSSMARRGGRALSFQRDLAVGT